VEPARRRIVDHLLRRLLAADLGEREGGALAVAQGAKPLEKGEDLGLRLVVEMVLEVERTRALLRLGDGGLSVSARSCIMKLTASKRKPSTPRSSQ
jgi:hypothetical protein